jgi:hypothetical protein
MAHFLEGFRKGLKQGSYRTPALPVPLLRHPLHGLPPGRDKRDLSRGRRDPWIRFSRRLRGAAAPYFDPVVGRLRKLGYGGERRRVPYEFLRGADEMLSVTGP